MERRAEAPNGTHDTSSQDGSAHKTRRFMYRNFQKTIYLGKKMSQIFCKIYKMKKFVLFHQADVKTVSSFIRRAEHIFRCRLRCTGDALFEVMYIFWMSRFVPCHAYRWREPILLRGSGLYIQGYARMGASRTVVYIRSH